VKNVIALLLYFVYRIFHTGNFQCPKIARLTAATRVKRGAVQNHSPGPRIYRCHYGVEFLEIGIGLIKEFGHVRIIARPCEIRVRLEVINPLDFASLIIV
jgi:hypothetical protein